MHACLNVDEIIRLIARELVGSEAGATAVALACCRRTFEDPVLDTLWETQRGLLRLLKSLPKDVWNGGQCTVSEPMTQMLYYRSAVWFESRSKDSQRPWNWLVSGNTPEGCDSSQSGTLKTTCI